MNPLLAALAVLLAFAAAWELAGSRGEELAELVRGAGARLSGGRVRSAAEAALALDVPRRLERAGLGGRISTGSVLAAKAAGVALGGCVALVALPAVPGRLAPLVALALPAAGFVGPDALLERTARLRRAGLVAALPDALDLLAVAVAGGRSPGAALEEISAAGPAPLSIELGIVAAEIECGLSQGEALRRLRARVPGAELGALAAALERSRAHGSPLAERLHELASALRGDARRRVEEQAARAAPKIQLVVALVLVPSVLLLILAALVAHSDALFSAV